MAASPTTPHISRYRTRLTDDASDDRLFSPVFQRNSPPLLVALAPWFGGRTGCVLEIGAGTGQHAGAFRLAFPGLDWVASDPDEGHRASVRAWARELKLGVREPPELDAATDWAARDDIRALGPLAAVVAMNVIHIAPLAVARGIVRGAGIALAPGGLLVFYGPFRENGRHVGEGNRTFDERLRAENPEWGIRDVVEMTDLARESGLEAAAAVAMPANNRLLLFRRPLA